MFYLGFFYMDIGERIGRLDRARAFELFRACAQKTFDTQCIFAYATALDYAIGVPRDPMMAYALYSLAGLKEPEVKARRRRDELGKTLSEEERARATVLANEFLKKPMAEEPRFKGLIEQAWQTRYGQPLSNPRALQPSKQ